MNTCTTRVLTLALAVFALAALAVPAGAFARGGTTTTKPIVGAVNLFPDATAPGAKGRVLSNNQGTGSGIWPMSYEVGKLADGRYAAVVVTTAAIDPTQAPTRITLNVFSVVNGKGGFSATLSTDFVPVAFEVYRLNDDFTQGPRMLSGAVAGGPYLG